MTGEAENRILVCGSRDWHDPQPIRQALEWATAIEGKLVVIHGDAEGADRIAKGWCEAKNVAHWPFPADWEKDGKAAGPIRNAAMVALKPLCVVCFSTRHPVTPGSADTCKRAQAAGIPVFLRVTGRPWRYYPGRGT